MASGTLKVRIIGDTKPLQKSLGNVTRTLGKFAAAAVTAGAVLAAKLGIDSVQAASALEQSVGAVESVFGPAGDAIRRFGDTAAEAFGLSRREVNETAAVLGAQLQSVGYEAGEAAGTVINLQKRAADMAATFGGSVSDALEAIGALMRGERDPIERYGVAIKQSDINARLAAEGLDGLEGEAKKQAEAQAALAILFEQTASTAGQFARESDTLAGKQERLSAKFENLKAILGDALLPVAEKVVDWAEENLPKAFEKATRFTEDHLVPAFDSISEWWDTNGPGITDAVQNFADGVADAFTSVRDALTDLVGWFDEANSNIGTSTSELRGQLSELWGQITEVFTIAGTTIAGIVAVFIATVQDMWDRFGQHLQDFVAETWGNIVTAIQASLQTLSGIFDVWIGLFTGDWQKGWDGIQSITSGAWDFIVNWIRTSTNTIGTILGGALSIWTKIWTAGWEGIRRKLSEYWQVLVSTVRTGVNNTVEFFVKLPGRIRDALVSLPGLLVSSGTDLIGGLWSGMLGMWDNVRGWLRALPSNIVSALSGIGGILTGIGRSIIGGLFGGMVDRAEGMLRWLSGLAGKIQSVKGPIEVDRRLLVPQGEAIIGGLEEGMRRQWGHTERLLRDMTASIPATADGGRRRSRSGGATVTQNFYGPVNEQVTGTAAALALRFA